MISNNAHCAMELVCNVVVGNALPDVKHDHSISNSDSLSSLLRWRKYKQKRRNFEKMVQIPPITIIIVACVCNLWKWQAISEIINLTLSFIAQPPLGYKHSYKWQIYSICIGFFFQVCGTVGSLKDNNSWDFLLLFFFKWPRNAGCRGNTLFSVFYQRSSTWW